MRRVRMVLEKAGGDELEAFRRRTAILGRQIAAAKRHVRNDARWLARHVAANASQAHQDAVAELRRRTQELHSEVVVAKSVVQRDAQWMERYLGADFSKPGQRSDEEFEDPSSDSAVAPLAAFATVSQAPPEQGHAEQMAALAPMAEASEAQPMRGAMPFDEGVEALAPPMTEPQFTHQLEETPPPRRPSPPAQTPTPPPADAPFIADFVTFAEAPVERPRVEPSALAAEVVRVITMEDIRREYDAVLAAVIRDPTDALDPAARWRPARPWRSPPPSVSTTSVAHVPSPIRATLHPPSLSTRHRLLGMANAAQPQAGSSRASRTTIKQMP